MTGRGTSGATDGGAPRSTAPWRGPFGRLLAAIAVSSVGDGLVVGAYPLLVLARTGDARLAALVFPALRLPWVIAPFLAALADRRSARRVHVAMDTLRAALFALLGVLALLDRLPAGVVFAAAFVQGAAEAVAYAASSRLVPSAVADPALASANGRILAVTINGEQFVGPPVGTALFALAPWVPFVGNAVSFAGSAVLLRGLPEPERDTTPATDAPGERVVSQVAAGLRFLARQPALLAATAAVAVVAASQGMMLATQVVLATRTLGIAPGAVGLFLAAVAVGNIVGGMVAAPLWSRVGTFVLFLGATLLVGLAYLGVSVTRSVPVVVALLVVEAVCVACLNVSSATIRQRLIPDALRGRVVTVIRLSVYAAQAVGGVLAARLLAVGGTDAVFLVAGGMLVALLPFVVRPLHRHLPADAAAAA